MLVGKESRKRNTSGTEMKHQEGFRQILVLDNERNKGNYRSSNKGARMQ